MLFKASLDLLPRMLELVGRELDGVKCSSKERNQVELCVEEALVNVINYAYPEGSGDLELGCRAEGSGDLEIVIKDWGIAFNPSHFVQDIQRNVAVESRKIGGLGVYFMHTLMDDVSYERVDGANVLRMRKKL